MRFYDIVYSDGVAGAALSWEGTLKLLRYRQTCPFVTSAGTVLSVLYVREVTR